VAAIDANLEQTIRQFEEIRDHRVLTEGDKDKLGDLFKRKHRLFDAKRGLEEQIKWEKEARVG
jgi:uncharacterized protein YhfF